MKLMQIGQLMEYFLSPPGMTPLWTGLLSFKTGWTEGPFLEPILRQAVQFKAETDSSLSMKLGTIIIPDHIGYVVTRGCAIVGGLKNAADNLNSLSISPSAAFNCLISVTTETDLAVARALYLTVRLHVIESILFYLTTQAESVSTSLDSRYEQLLDSSSWLEVYDAVCVVLEDVDSSPTAAKGLAYRAFCMLWPMIALLRSCLAVNGFQSLIKGKLCLLGTSTGLGLCSLAGQ